MKRFRLIEEKTQQVGLTPELAEADRVDYIALIKQIVRVGGGMGGVSLEEMERGLRLLKALDGKKLGDILELEDSDHAHLCQYVRTFRWPVVDERLVRFAHTILNATESVLGEEVEKEAEQIARDAQGGKEGDLAATAGLDGHDR